MQRITPYLPGTYFQTVQSTVVEAHKKNEAAEIQISTQIRLPGKEKSSIKLSTDFTDWIKNPTAPSEGDPLVLSFEMPVIRLGQEVAKAVLAPKWDPESNEWGLTFHVDW